MWVQLILNLEMVLLFKSILYNYDCGGIYMNNLGNKIYELRKMNGLTQQQLAEKLDVSNKAVSKWELGETTPELDNIHQLAAIFNVSYDYLLSDKEIKIEEEKPTQVIYEEKKTNEIIHFEPKYLIFLIFPVLMFMLFFLKFYTIEVYQPNFSPLSESFTFYDIAGSATEPFVKFAYVLALIILLISSVFTICVSIFKIVQEQKVLLRIISFAVPFVVTVLEILGWLVFKSSFVEEQYIGIIKVYQSMNALSYIITILIPLVLGIIGLISFLKYYKKVKAN